MNHFQKTKTRAPRKFPLRLLSGAVGVLFLCLYPHTGTAQVVSAPATVNDPRRDATVAAVELTSPSVVNIATRIRGGVVRRRVFDFWRGIIEIPERLRDRNSAGSGVIVDEEGYVLTNVHVVTEEGKVVDEIWVQLWDDSPPIRARALVGVPGTDVAVLKLEAEPGRKFQPIKMAADDDLLLGETVLALGNPLGLGSSVTKGILSAKPRRAEATKDRLEIPDWLQIDAPINPGNSGGPLVNLKGEMIGLNVAISEGGQGIGFAIPVRQISTAVSECFSPEVMHGRWLGLRFRPAEGKTYTVSAVHPGSPADKAGLRPGDVLTRINGVEPKSRFDALAIMAASDQRVRFTRLRDGESSELTVSYKTLAALVEEKTGMTVREIDPKVSAELDVPVGAGLLVEAVARGSAAAQAGVRPGSIFANILLPGETPKAHKTGNLLAAASILWNVQAGDRLPITAYGQWSPRSASYVPMQFLLEFK